MNRVGRYQIVKELGRGAMGLVYHAVDPTIGRPVAIKTIRIPEMSNPADQERLRDRLIREARSAGILSHPNIVTIYDISADAELAYIAMEFVDGPTLEQVMASGQALDSSKVLKLLRQAAGALDYAHARGIVHRDIKPANLMIADGDLMKITDFGIAKATTADQFTMTGTIVGTPNYMAPEQVQGLPVDGRADQFSLAVIAYELITGEKPFTGEHLTTIVYKIVAEEPPPTNRLNATVGPHTESALRRALAKKPDARYGSCCEFVDALEKAAAGRSWQPLPRGASLSQPTLVEAVRPVLPPPRPRQEEPPPRRSGLLPLLAALLLTAAILAAVIFQTGIWQDLAPGPPAENRSAGNESDGKPSALAEPVQRAPAPPKPAEPSKPLAAGGTPADGADPARTESAAAEDGPAEAVPQATPEPPKPEAPARAKVRTRALEPQPVAISTSPAGATATLSGDPAMSCRTPCTIHAPPGNHQLSVVLPGYQVERRDVLVGEAPEEVSLITLRRLGGVLMLSSTPPGAAITINGRPRPETTPARLELPAGTYSITVEKNGQRRTVQVEIRNGMTKYQPVQLGS